MIHPMHAIFFGPANRYVSLSQFGACAGRSDQPTRPGFHRVRWWAVQHFRLYDIVPRLWPRYVFSDRVDTRLVPPAFDDSSGVRGVAWLGSGTA
jgi:hypothetical protein